MTTCHKTTDQTANHKLMLACRRLDTLFSKSEDEIRREVARGDVVSAMATLLEEFGLVP